MSNTEALRVAAQQALDALTNCASEHGHRCNRCDSEVDDNGSITAALRAALAQQPAARGEPVAQKLCECGKARLIDCVSMPCNEARAIFYATPHPAPARVPQAPWIQRQQPFTDSQIDAILNANGLHEPTEVLIDRQIARAIEAAHGIAAAPDAQKGEP